MENYKEKLKECLQIINRICTTINSQNIPSDTISCNELYNILYQLIPLIPDEYYIFRDRLRDNILPLLRVPDLIETDQYGNQFVTPLNGINPYSLGKVTATIAYLNKYSNNNPSSIWENIHPLIKSVAKNRFDDGYYADAVEAAFKEINISVKKIYKNKTNIEKDGAKLMQAAFSTQNPIIKLGDISTENGFNTQLGYMEMFAGAINGIRNPKAHSNQTISKSDAIRKLHFASMLMYKIDNELMLV